MTKPRPYNPQETERLLADHGMASGKSARDALETLLHGQHEGWAVVGVDDQTALHLDRPLSDRPPREVSPRTRTITIRLLERRARGEEVTE